MRRRPRRRTTPVAAGGRLACPRTSTNSSGVGGRTRRPSPSPTSANASRLGGRSTSTMTWSSAPTSFPRPTSSPSTRPRQIAPRCPAALRTVPLNPVRSPPMPSPSTPTLLPTFRRTRASRRRSNCTNQRRPGSAMPSLSSTLAREFAWLARHTRCHPPRCVSNDVGRPALLLLLVDAELGLPSSQ